MGLGDLNFELRPPHTYRITVLFIQLSFQPLAFFSNFDIGSVCMRMDTVLLLFIIFFIVGNVMPVDDEIQSYPFPQFSPSAPPYAHQHILFLASCLFLFIYLCFITHYI